MTSDTPECDKLAEVSNERDTIVEFIEWLRDQGIHLAHYVQYEGYRDQTLAPDSTTDVSWAHQFLDIDETALEAERRALLAELRELASGGQQ